MNHIGAKTETAWDQLAQTQNYDHPIRNQQSPPQPVTPASAPKAPIINQTAGTAQLQQTPQPNQTPQQQQPEYGDELHPELV